MEIDEYRNVANSKKFVDYCTQTILMAIENVPEARIDDFLADLQSYAKCRRERAPHDLTDRYRYKIAMEIINSTPTIANSEENEALARRVKELCSPVKVLGKELMEP